MPLYFGTVAPTCPTSRDQVTPPLTRPLLHRTTIPRAYDLQSAIQSANFARSIVTALTRDTVINNVYNAPSWNGTTTVAPIKDKTKTSRWTEQKQKRVFQNYKYFGKTKDGKKDTSTWVVMQRIEQMVWYDSVWKSYLKWTYGDKGEGEPTGAATGPGTVGEG